MKVPVLAAASCAAVAFVVGVLADFVHLERTVDAVGALPSAATMPVEAGESSSSPEFQEIAQRQLQEPRTAQFVEQVHDTVRDSVHKLVEDLEAERSELAQRCRELTSRVEWLEVELDLCGSSVTRGTLGDWLAILRPDERPPRPVLVQMAGLLHAYPGVALTPDEGLWIAERFRLDDWKAWAPTIDEALIRFLGPARIAAQVSPERLAELREEWAGSGLF